MRKTRIKRCEGGCCTIRLEDGGRILRRYSRSKKKASCRGELDRAIIYNVDVPAGTLSRDSDHRLRPRDTKNRSEISSSRVMRAYRKRTEQRREIRCACFLITLVSQRPWFSSREREMLMESIRSFSLANLYGELCDIFFSPTRNKE